MTILNLILPVLSLVALAAHFFRAGATLPVIVVLASFFLFAVRRAWAVRTLQAVLILGSMEWIRTALAIKARRDALGEPGGRMLVILGSVALAALVSAALLETRRLKRIRKASSDPITNL